MENLAAFSAREVKRTAAEGRDEYDNEKISGGGKNGVRKGVGSAIRWRRANRGAYTLRNLTLHRTVTDFLRLSVFLRLVVEALGSCPASGLHGLLPCPHFSKGVG